MKNLCLPARLHLLLMAGGLSIAYSLLVVVSSCKQKTDYSKEIARLDSINSALNSAQIDFNKSTRADSTALVAGALTVSGSIEEITGYFPTDTIKKEMAIFLSELSALKDTLNMISENNHYYSHAIVESQLQIHRLKADLEKDLVEKNKVQEYVVNEINAAKTIIEGLNRVKERTLTALNKLDSIKPQIIFIKDSLRSR